MQRDTKAELFKKEFVKFVNSLKSDLMIDVDLDVYAGVCDESADSGRPFTQRREYFRCAIGHAFMTIEKTGLGDAMVECRYKEETFKDLIRRQWAVNQVWGVYIATKKLDWTERFDQSNTHEVRVSFHDDDLYADMYFSVELQRPGGAREFATVHAVRQYRKEDEHMNKIVGHISDDEIIIVEHGTVLR